MDTIMLREFLAMSTKQFLKQDMFSAIGNHTIEVSKREYLKKGRPQDSTIQCLHYSWNKQTKVLAAIHSKTQAVKHILNYSEEFFSKLLPQHTLLILLKNSNHSKKPLYPQTNECRVYVYYLPRNMEKCIQSYDLHIGEIYLQYNQLNLYSNCCQILLYASLAGIEYKVMV